MMKKGLVMEKEKFSELLKVAGLSKKDFAELVGTSAGAVSNWGVSGRDFPYWIESWINLYIDNKSFKKLKSAIKDSGACE